MAIAGAPFAIEGIIMCDFLRIGFRLSPEPELEYT
jgi:hypothetical protein